MMKNNRRPLGVYIHIPFCIRKCNYCDFLSFPGDTSSRREYAETLVQEMNIWKEKVSMVDTIFIGGGTPSVLTPGEMDIIFQGLYDNFPMVDVREFTVECNPGTVTEDKLSMYRQAGVNRISFGMQSTVEEELKKLGRIHSYEEFIDSYELARKMGFDNVNVDIMSAIPGQTLASYEKTLRRVVGLKPEHISSYSLIIEEGTPFYESYAEQPPVDEETDRQMYERTEEILAGAGYARYEISNYAKRGRECRHNLKYWRRDEYLGLGLGAASFLSHTRFSNEWEMLVYQRQIRNGECPVAETENLSPADEKAEFMYLGLRCMKGISVRQFYECFDEKIEECFGEVIKHCQEQGLLRWENDRIYLTRRGIDVSNRVFEEFV